MIDRTDEEIGELVKAWIRRYGLPLIAGVIIALAAIFAARWWQAHKQQGSHQFSDQLATLNRALDDKNYAQAETAYQTLQQEHTIYSQLADLAMAKSYVAQKKPAQAEALLQNAQGSSDKLISETALFSLAQLQTSEKKYPQALQTLSKLEGSAYQAQIEALRGDIYVLQNKLADALSAYQRAQDAQPSPLTEMRINLLKGQVSLQKAPKESTNG